MKTSEVAKQFPWFQFSKTCPLCKLCESQTHSLVSPASEYLVVHLASFPSEKAMESPARAYSVSVLSHTSLRALSEPSGLDSNGQFTGYLFGQHSTIPNRSSCRSNGWMPSGSRDLFTFSCYLGLKHPISLALFHLITLTSVFQKTFSEWESFQGFP